MSKLSEKILVAIQINPRKKFTIDSGLIVVGLNMTRQSSLVSAIKDFSSSKSITE